MAYEFFIIILLIVLIILCYFIYKKVKEEKKIEGYGDVMKTLGKMEEALKKEEEKREETEKKREERMKAMNDSIMDFVRTISGTKKRGMVGEEILKQALIKPIQSGIVKTDLKVDNNQVEFAWNLGDGKYVPIDAKLPDVIGAFSEYLKTEDVESQKEIKKDIERKIRKHIEEIKKYKNKKNTINKCILAIPDEITNLLPDINSDFNESGVIVSGYQNVFLYANLIDEEYHRSIEEGDVGEYKLMLSNMVSIVQDIQKKTATIDKGIKEISNANDEIKKASIEAERHKIKK